jgi:hypothetical protein
MNRFLANQIILKKFNFRCVVCYAQTFVLHEIEPKSQRPDDWEEEENRVPLCSIHHNLVHSEGAIVWKERLIEYRRKALERFSKQRFNSKNL